MYLYLLLDVQQEFACRATRAQKYYSTGLYLQVSFDVSMSVLTYKNRARVLPPQRCAKKFHSIGLYLQVSFDV